MNNGHVFEFITRSGIQNTARELMSFERCPEGLTLYSFKNTLAALKERYSKLRKNSYKDNAKAECFQSFSSAAYEYPPPAPAPSREKSVVERHLQPIGDAETYAKVALELGAELHETKASLDNAKQKAKRKIVELKEKVAQKETDNRDLNNALFERNEDYKR